MSDPITMNNKYAYVGNSPTIYSDPSGAIFGIDDLLFIAIAAGSGAIANGSQHGYSAESLIQGALMGASLGAAIIGVSSLIGGVQGAFSGGQFAVGGQTGTSSIIGAIRGIASPGLGAEIAAGLLGVPAAVGLFDPNANSDLRNYANNFLTAGATGGLLKAAVFTVGLPTADPNLISAGQSYFYRGNVVNQGTLTSYNSIVWGMRLQLYGQGALPLAGYRR